jgi:hypothetical protein
MVRGCDLHEGAFWDEAQGAWHTSFSVRHREKLLDELRPRATPRNNTPLAPLPWGSINPVACPSSGLVCVTSRPAPCKRG